MLIFAALLATASAHTTTVVVLPFTGAGDTAARDKLADDVRTAINDLGWSAVPKKAADDVVNGARALGIACDIATTACAVQLGGLAGADLVVYGAVTPQHNLSARAIEVGAQKERSHALVALASTTASATEAKLLAVRLLAPERERGRIAVHAAPDGAVIVVDGVARGTKAVLVEVAPGVAHEVYVAKPGYDSHSESATVKFDDEVSFDVVLKPSKGTAATPLPLVLREPPPAAFGDEAPAKKRYVRVAVYELVAPDDPPRVSRVVTEALLAEMRKLDGVSVVGLDEIRAMIDFEAKKQLAGCAADTSCLSDIAGALGADVVVVGTLAHVGDGTVFGARRLDQKTAQVSAQVNRRFVDAGGEEYIAAVGGVVGELFPELPLRAGQHRGADPALALRVNPPPLAPWVFWSTVGVSGAVAAGTAAVGVVNLGAHGRFDGVTSAQQGSDVVTNEELTFNTAVAFYTGVGLTVTTVAVAGVEALFTDWWGYGDASLDVDTAAARENVAASAAVGAR